ncbi:transketolase [Candidatus Nitrospira inopinata]|jgi:transketolase|uniref:Transketolase n=1 Tax=Candidatus Nitrospira inopinata TaxID=1715989 RepID=A0A0S4KS21_9BACT|nr:transketolase [Candidatus Nitrospira inopinata]CUQ67143.1 Transketolase [Candidatus Nitrospira inopinata]
MAGSAVSPRLLTFLQNKATQLRIDSVRSTSEAGSGHPSSCCSAADIVAVLFFSVMRYDPHNPKTPNSDRFVLSKGHAAPLLYAAWAEAGLFPTDDLLKLRTLTSDLEGHPTPRLPFVDMATGSLGQGLAVGVGLALNAKRLEKNGARTYVLMGDGESVEGSVWESVELARHFKLDNLCAIVDVNRLGQSDPTMLQHDMQAYKARWRGFGWNALVVDGHNHKALLAAFAEAAKVKGKPTVLLAKTLKGKGISFMENHPSWHGKPIPKGAESQKAIDELTRLIKPTKAAPKIKTLPPPSHRQKPAKPMAPPSYKPGDLVATREAFGTALVAMGEADPSVVALDADVKNSTYTDKFAKQFPDRFFENFIAEQNMVGTAAGLAACGKIPFVATFAAFFTRAYDFIRMAAISESNIKLVGTHVGVSIGEDGPSQMGLEDIAMMAAQPGMTVLYPSDATATHRLVEAAAQRKGMTYIRTGRPKTPVLYGPEESFPIGGSKVVRQSQTDSLTIVAAGVTLFEALKAHDELQAAGISVRVIDLYSIVPIDRTTLLDSARATQNRILTVEDHYAHGGLGDAVLNAVSTEGIKIHKLAVRQIPHSGKPEELIGHYGIGARAIVEAVNHIVK